MCRVPEHTQLSPHLTRGTSGTGCGPRPSPQVQGAGWRNGGPRPEAVLPRGGPALSPTGAALPTERVLYCAFERGAVCPSPCRLR